MAGVDWGSLVSRSEEIPVRKGTWSRNGAHVRWSEWILEDPRERVLELVAVIWVPEGAQAERRGTEARFECDRLAMALGMMARDLAPGTDGMTRDPAAYRASERGFHSKVKLITRPGWPEVYDFAVRGLTGALP